MSQDRIGDFLTVMRNGLMVGKRSVTVQHSMLKQNIAEVLKNEGYIRDFKVDRNGHKVSLTVVLKYVNGEAVIHQITRVSKCGRRHYERVNNLQKVIGGLGIAVLTTSRGVMTDRQAEAAGIGGEVICHLW